MRPPCALRDLPAGAGLLVRAADATCRSLAHCEQVVGAAQPYYCVVRMSGGYLAQGYRHGSRTNPKIYRWKNGRVEGRGRKQEMKKRKRRRGRDRGDYVLPGRVLFHRRSTHVSAGLARLPVNGRLLGTGR